MIADGPRKLSPSPLSASPAQDAPGHKNRIRGKTERRKLYLADFCKQCSLFYTSGSPFFLSFSISLSPHVEEEEEEEEKEESSLCEMPRCSQSIVLLAVRLN